MNAAIVDRRRSSAVHKAVSHELKTQKSTGAVAVPRFAAEVICQRLVLAPEEPGDHPLFFTRDGDRTRPLSVVWRRRAAGAA